VSRGSDPDLISNVNLTSFGILGDWQIHCFFSDNAFLREPIGHAERRLICEQDRYHGIF